MKTGYRGTFVISWAQTEVDGLVAAPTSALGVGASWNWQGEALRVDGPPEVLRLVEASGEADLRLRAARVVHKLVGAALRPGREMPRGTPDEPLLNVGFEVTDGRQSYVATVIETVPDAPPLLMFTDEVPPRGVDLWVVRAQMQPARINRLTDQPTGVICFTPGTMIGTAEGALPIETLREGDLVQTKDDGLEKILWIGTRRITGARLYAMPEMRPVRIRAGALNLGEPDADLIVSPEHRVLLRGPQARALFNTDEVLVTARDLIDDRRIHVDQSLREVTYYHMLLERHEVVFANGVETESFHPASAALETVHPDQRARLLTLYPGLDFDPLGYGGYARRNLSRNEAALLLSAVA